jgi:NAD(P)-dependent dehydrogenase (short-subunit alcohol dehydrogenase family)
MAGLPEGKVAVVTGGASGMGEATVETFAREGARVVIADIQDEPGEALAARLGDSAAYVHTDVTEQDALEAVVAAAARSFGKLDIMFSNAGAGGDQSPVVDLSTEGLESALALNLKSHVYALKHAARQMIKQGTGGSLICTSSTAGVQSGWAAAGYSMAKAGVLALVRATALELGTSRIRSNAIIPGLVLTPIIANYTGAPAERHPEFFKLADERLGPIQPIGRAGVAQDIANAALFLASDLSSYLTGVELPVDGGALSTNKGGLEEATLGIVEELAAQQK